MSAGYSPYLSSTAIVSVLDGDLGFEVYFAQLPINIIKMQVEYAVNYVIQLNCNFTASNSDVKFDIHWELVTI